MEFQARRVRTPARRQGRVLRLRFACRAELPLGTVLRVATVDDDDDDDDDDDNKVDNESDHGGGRIHGGDGVGDGDGDDAAPHSGGSKDAGTSSSGGGSGGRASKLLENTTEMVTTPETYPVWRTLRPVVVIDDGGTRSGDGDGGSDGDDSQTNNRGNEGPFIHRYRYLAVTPGASIDWDMVMPEISEAGGDDDDDDNDDDVNNRDDCDAMREFGAGDGGEGAGMDVDLGNDDDDNVLSYNAAANMEEEDRATAFPPLLYENPPPHCANGDDDRNDDNDDDGGAGESSEETTTAQHQREQHHHQHQHQHQHHQQHQHQQQAVVHPAPASLFPYPSPTGSSDGMSSSGMSSGGSSASVVALEAMSTSASMISLASSVDYGRRSTIDNNGGTGGAPASHAARSRESIRALPYRTRRAESASAADSAVDRWNDADDPAFYEYWETTAGGRGAGKEIAREEEEEEGEGEYTTTTMETEEETRIARYPPARLPVPHPPPAAAPEQKRLFLVCFHLPVILTRDPETFEWSACWSESLIARSDLRGVSSTRPTTWIGTVSGVPAECVRGKKDQDAVRAVLAPMSCVPVFFDDDCDDSDSTGGGSGGNADYCSAANADLMYLGFCKQVLWPSFHNVDLLDLATQGWGQRQRRGGSGMRLDHVAACALAEAEGCERRRSKSRRAAGHGGGRGESTAETASPSAAAAGTSSSGLESDWDQGRLDSWWCAYVAVNRRFGRAVAELVRGGEEVWVHDYHLALLPRMLREARGELKDHHHHGCTPQREGGKVTTAKGPEGDGDDDAASARRPVRMIFFIHVPFPTSQVFRELEHGEALLEGMLQADVVGFHAFDHARHFLNAAKRILGLTYESLAGGLIGVRHRGTRVLVTVSNVSVETDIIDALLSFPSVKEDAEDIRRRHGGRAIVAGVAVAQRLSGVSLKLLAFERLLTDYPVWQSKVVLLQRCLIAGTRRVDEADTLREVRALVQRIRSRFGPDVIDYEEQVGSVLPIDQRLAIWMSSRVIMHTPIREGLNLWPLEYVYARREPADPGVLIASEFSAVSSVLNGALRVNPFDVQMCVTSIDCALSMSYNERDARRGRDIDFVSSCSSGLWTRNVLRDLDDATHPDARIPPSSSSSSRGGNGDQPSRPLSPAPLVSRENDSGLERLDVDAVRSAYASTSNRVVVIDFNGTLVVKEPPGKYLKREILGTSGYRPSSAATSALADLCADPRNTVYVVSGDSQQNLEGAVGNVPGLGLAASNGACYANPVVAGGMISSATAAGGEPQQQQRIWKFLDFGVDWNAVKKVAMPIISKYTARTNGSFVKLTHSSIGWSYYSCDPEWGSLQASHLVPELERKLRSYDVRFVALKGIVEVVPRKLHKGHIVKKILERAHARSKRAGSEGVDFVLCVGDDISDEKMFTSVGSFIAETDTPYSFAYNVAVGKKRSNASFFVDGAQDVAEVLAAMTDYAGGGLGGSDDDASGIGLGGARSQTSPDDSEFFE